MTETPQPPAAELPTLRELNRATLGAAAVAALLLVTAVLPAEYGLDPIGTGRLLGLTRMGEMKQAQGGATGAAAPAGDTSIIRTADGGTQVRIVIRPYGGREVKAWMKNGQAFEYDWASDGPAVEFEFHGDHDKATGEDYSSYEKGTSAGGTGSFRAAFDGRHGWYWHNLTPDPVTVTATVTGQFEKFAPIS